MKQIGQLENGRLLFEVSPREAQAFGLLEDAVKGVAFNRGLYSSGPLDFEISKAIDAIAEWVSIKDRANNLRQMADDIDKVIRMNNDPDRD